MLFLEENLRRMTVGKNIGMDYVIVSCSSSRLEQYWQERLEDTISQISKESTRVLVICEDWPGGAGNGLGSLYAVRKAVDKAAVRYQVDLIDELKSGAAVALYHTAGKGTRLAPLPASESNNKPAV